MMAWQAKNAASINAAYVSCMGNPPQLPQPEAPAQAPAK
jgi:hypothetical protein